MGLADRKANVIHNIALAYSGDLSNNLIEPLDVEAFVFGNL